VWDTRYRPLTFADVLGQQGSIAVLKARLRNGSAWETSYLFCGGHGMGKTTLGRIMARAMLCQRLNLEDPEPCNECDNCKAALNDTSQAFQERDAASQGKIEHVRKIVDELPFTVLDAPKRIYLFDECHRISKDAQDVLLKPIEEKTMVAMFCTTEPEKVRGPIRSRCEEHMIRRVTREEILVWVKRVLDKESVPHEDDAVLTVIDYTGGHLRDVLNRLEMIAQGGDITLDRVREELNLSLVSVFYEILLSLPTDLPEALSLLDKVRERVTAEEAASGLAEAAMNSFRQANKMVADFAFTDRALADQVSGLYKDQVVRVAEYFLRSRYITYIGLTCDLATLAHSLRSGTVAAPAPPTRVASFQPIQTVAAPQAQTQVRVEAPQPAPQAPTAPSQVEPKVETTPAPQPAPQAPELNALQAALKRPFTPSTPACTLTDNDADVIPTSKIVSKQPKNIIEDLNRANRDPLTPLAADVWRRIFKTRLEHMKRSGRA